MSFSLTKKLSTLVLTTSLATLLHISFAQAGTELKTEIAYQQALKCHEISQGINLDTEIQGGLDISKVDKEGNVSTVKDTGAGLMRVFEDEYNNLYVILGKRFGLFWKFSVGGKVEPEDMTLRDAFKREIEEELFGQLKLIDDQLIMIKNQQGTDLITTAGGMEIQTDKDGTQHVITQGWGPYYTAFALQKGYTFDQLQAAITIMDNNAGRHTKLASLFNKEFDQKSAETRQQEAKDILKFFDQAKETPGFVDMSDIAKSALETIAETGHFDFGSSDAFKFAQDHIHTYSEYSAFKLLPWAVYVEESEIDAQKAKKKPNIFLTRK